MAWSYLHTQARMLNLERDAQALPFFQALRQRPVATLQAMQRAGINSPLTSSCGRLFDAVSALIGICQEACYEGQAAIELEAACTTVAVGEGHGWDVDVSTVAGMTVVDPSPLVTRVIAERRRGTAVHTIAAGFHDGLGRAVADVATVLAADAGLDTVALSGGVFQNARLTEVVAARVEASGLAVLVHERLPPNDGGISVGQAAIAAR